MTTKNSPVEGGSAAAGPGGSGQGGVRRDARPLVSAALQAAARRLAAAGFEQPRREARLLLATALDCEPGEVLTRDDEQLGAAARRRVANYLERRLAREPLSRIRGYREFWSQRFEISPDTLDPRPDSETLIEAVLERLPDRQRAYRVLDLGVGSGCLLLALLSELPRAVGCGVDCNRGAVATARRNAAALRLADRSRIQPGDWGADLPPGFDVVIANPPYIPSGSIAGLMPEVRDYEPRLALDGGEDGLAAYRALAGQLPRLLAASGFAALELGTGQARSVAELMTAAGLVIRGVRHDLSGIERCMIVERV